MHDLSSTMFYKAKFTLVTQNDSEDLLWTLICEIKKWLIEKHNQNGKKLIPSDNLEWTRFKFGWKLYDQMSSHLFFAKSLYHVAKDNPAIISWACKIEENPEPQDGYAPREWITEIGYQSSQKNIAEISYVVRYSDRPGYLGELSPIPGSSLPRVVRSFLYNSKYICKSGSTALRAHPIHLKNGDYPTFEKILFDVDRSVPIIYISPKPSTECPEDCTPLISPKELARCVAGNAMVYYSTDSSFLQEMQYMCDNKYTCSDGAIRVYQPLMDKSNPNDKYRHRIVFGDYIAEHGAQVILDMFRRALAQDVYYFETMFRLEACQRLIDADKNQERIDKITLEKDDEYSQAYDEYQKKCAETDLLEQKLETANEEIKRLGGDIYSLRLQVAANQDKANQLDSILNTNDLICSVSEYPATHVQIAQYFGTVFGDRITFTDRAYKSLKDCNSRKDVLWNALFCMATDLYDYCHAYPSQAYKKFTDKTGWACGRGVGSATRSNSKLMRQYVDYFDGHEIDIEPHIKTGTHDNDPKSIRIYFAYDPKICDKLIVGHCGGHLDNATTRKIK